VQSGAPLDVWRAPADAWAAGFLGFANVLPVVVAQGVATTPWGDVPTSRADGPAALVVRPGALRFAAAGPVHGVAGAARFRGDHVAVPVAVDDGGLLEVVVRDARVPAAGTSVAVAVDLDDVVVVAR
jgi:ABC-type Fe3+/spermidine/putrescine transport system ATPase subunit